MNTKLPRLIPPLSSNLLTKTSHLFIQPHKTTRYSTHSLQTLQNSLNTNNPIITNICNSLHKGENWESLTEKFQSLHFTTPKTSHFFIQPHKNSYSTHSLQVPTNINNPIITSICNSLRKGENWESLTKKFQSFHFTPSIIQEILLHLKEPIDAKNALNFFHWSAKNSNTRHGVFIYCVIIHILAKSKLVRHANALIESALRNETLFVVLDSLIGSYKLVDSCPFVFDLFVQSCAKLRLIDKSLDVCKLLDENGFMLSVISYNTLLHVVQKSENTCMVWGIYEYMIEKRIYPNEMTTRIMISALCKEGRLQRFLDVVEKSHGKRCQQPGVVVNTCLIYGMIEEDRIEDGLRLMKRMLQKNMILDTISCSLVVLAKVKTRDLESAWGVYDEMVRRGFEGNALVYDSFIGAYCEEERIDEAIKLMDEMECLNMKPFDETFNHLIKVCSEVGRLEESLKFCDKMIAYGFVPSCLSFNKLVAKLCENGNAKCADQLLTKLMDKGFVPDQSMYAYLIAGYANVGDVEGALKLYYEMQFRSISPNASIFDSLIIALCQRGRLKEADEFLSLMIGQSLKPGIHVYKKLIASHLDRGDETRAHHLYRQRRTEIDNIRSWSAKNLMQAGIIPSLFKLSSHSCYSGSGGLLERLPLTGADVVSLDWTVDMADGRRQLGPDVAVQGNVDPGVLVAQRNVCQINDIVKKAGKGKHLLNLGHGIKVGTPAHFFEIAEGLREWHYQVLEGQVDRKLHYAGSISHHFQSSPGSGCCHCNLQRRD